MLMETIVRYLDELIVKGYPEAEGGAAEAPAGGGDGAACHLESPGLPPALPEAGGSSPSSTLSGSAPSASCPEARPPVSLQAALAAQRAREAKDAEARDEPDVLTP
ncbi:unnamed protein product [Prorocentrum cordatum]|uniref:Uncharacterized protein n=1 Tax=Prorocentrum cordatum TaxID=2364126 RepID=A0ABN9R5L0_9DINO|nr:unnamed protein product [Polarella glacialis]